MSRLAVLTAGIVVLIALTGCTATGPRPVPLSRAARIALYEKQTDAEWRAIAASQPSTPRPDLRVQTVSSGSQWVLDIAGCLREEKAPDFTVTPGGAISLAGGVSDNGVGLLPVFVCQARHPRTEDLTRLMSDSQLSSLYDYYVDSLRPCLLLNAGEALRAAPTRAEFIRSYYTKPWSPNDPAAYALYTTGDAGTVRLSALGKRCPPFPSWLPD
jgi:hypothetical protein